MTLKRLYIKGVILPSIIVVVATAVLSLVDPNDYSSEWVTKESIIFMSVLFSFIYSIIICALALTIFLNYQIIKTSGLAPFLSWFLLPITWIIIALSKSLYHRQKYYPDGTNIDLFYLIILNLPFVIGLIWTYILFKKKVAPRLNTDTNKEN